MDVITYPCPNLIAGSIILCGWMGLQRIFVAIRYSYVCRLRNPSEVVLSDEKYKGFQTTTHRWSLGMDKYCHPTLYNGRDYLSMLGLKFIHISKRVPGRQKSWMMRWRFQFLLSSNHLPRGNERMRQQYWSLFTVIIVCRLYYILHHVARLIAHPLAIFIMNPMYTYSRSWKIPRPMCPG